MTLLPDVLPVISIASSIGTPAAISPENVRDRANATFWTMSPMYRELQLERVPLHAPAFAALPIAEQPDHGEHDREHHIPALREHVRQPHGELGDGRQLAAEVLEDVLEDRHEERHQRGQHDEREAADQQQGRPSPP